MQDSCIGVTFVSKEIVYHASSEIWTHDSSVREVKTFRDIDLIQNPYRNNTNS
jgi:hypothetical protein